jgi:hypothetical protein
VILIDSNILIYSTARPSEHHERARDWLNAQLSGTAKVGLPWVSLMAFLRLVTNPRIVKHPVPMADAWGQVSDWLACEVVWTPQPTDRHAATFGSLIASSSVTANLVTDAHLVALAIEHGLTLCSADGDFARFRGLRWQNPVA